jgi:hypothetical protein
VVSPAREQRNTARPVRAEATRPSGNYCPGARAREDLHGTNVDRQRRVGFGVSHLRTGRSVDRSDCGVLSDNTEAPPRDPRPLSSETYSRWGVGESCLRYLPKYLRFDSTSKAKLSVLSSRRTGPGCEPRANAEGLSVSVWGQQRSRRNARKAVLECSIRRAEFDSVEKFLAATGPSLAPLPSPDEAMPPPPLGPRHIPNQRRRGD